MIAIEGQLPETIDIALLERLLASTRKQLHRDDGAPVGLRFVDRDEMKTLARTYAGKDAETDVLSFEPDESDPTDLGDIVICTDIAKEQAFAHRSSFMEEVSLLFVHGLLHLMGLDHGSEGEKQQMEAHQKAILSANRLRQRRYL